jgi:hypothetical protein
MPRAASGPCANTSPPSRSLAPPRRDGDTACQPVRPPRTQARQRQHRPASAAGQRERRRWQDLVSPHVKMGVPHLLMLLEPMVLWEHAPVSPHPAAQLHLLDVGSSCCVGARWIS